MSRTLRLAAVVVGALVTATGCAAAHDSGTVAPGARSSWPQLTPTSRVPATPDGHLFTDPQGHYRLTIGDDWFPLPIDNLNVVDAADDVTELWQLPLLDNGFAGTVNIYAENAEGDDLAEYLEDSHRQPYGNTFVAIKIVKSNDGRDLGLLDYKGDLRSTGPSHFLTVVDIVDNHAVVATLGTDESDFEKYRPTIEPFLLTLRAT